MQEQQASKRRIRVTALALALVAVGFYVAFIIAMASK